MDILSAEQFKEFNEANLIVNATMGGFVIGRSHDEGNIYMVKKNNTGDYDFFASMEGGEYILNPIACFHNKERIEFINNDKKERRILTFDDIVKLKSIICTKMDKYDKILLFEEHSQFIVNKISTSYYLEELDEINNREYD